MALNYENNAQPTAPQSGGTKAKLIIAWLIVAVPAAWGVARTVQNSLPLFTSPAAVSPATAPAAELPATQPAK